MIRHLRHQEIDKAKWDEALSKCHQSLLFAQSWYLDLVAPEWGAFIRGDYEELMPLPVKSKLGFKYLVQPNFTAQLGVFSTKNQHVNVDQWLSFLQKKYRRYDINLNTSNSLSQKEILPLLNCELKLNDSYEELYKAFSKGTKRNVKKALNCKIYEITFGDFLPFKLRNIKGVSPSMYETLSQLNTAFESNQIPVSIFAIGESEILAAAMFVYFKERIIYFNGASNEEGKEKRGMFAIMNQLIQKHQNSNLILDFKGGQMEGTRRFFKGFGAEEKTYVRIKRSL